MKLLKFIVLIYILGIPGMVQSQTDTVNDVPSREYVTSSFEATRVILGHSTEIPNKGALMFLVAHHFGTINSGWYDFFGLDQANTRLGFDYGINDWLAIGIGRTSVQKVYDGYIKAKILRQSTGDIKMPVTLTYVGAIGITSLEWTEPERENYFSSRISYVHQLLLARKFTKNLSLQLTPTLVHRNLVETKEDQNDVWSLGAGGRYTLSTTIFSPEKRPMILTILSPSGLTWIPGDISSSCISQIQED